MQATTSPPSKAAQGPPPHANAYLHQRGFTDRAIADAGLRVEPIGDRTRRYGLPDEAANAPALFIPYPAPNGRAAFERIRLIDQADLERFGGGKYRQPARRPLGLYDPYGVLAHDGPLDGVLLVEGELNAVAAHELLPDMPLVGLPGQNALKPQLAAELAHVPVVFAWLDAQDNGYDKNLATIAERLLAVGVDEVRCIDSAGLDANEVLRHLGIDKAREEATKLLARATARVAELAPEPNGNNTFELRVETTREVCELPDPPLAAEVIGPLVVRGERTVIGGYTGEGKTTLTTQIAAAVESGGECLGFQAQQGRVLIIDAEQGLRIIKRRLREAGLNTSDNVDYVRVPDGLDLGNNQQHIDAVEHQLAERNYLAVIADPLYKLHRGDSNDEREAVDLMRTFDAWRERYGFALILPVHPRKRPPGGTKFTKDEFFGSGAYLRGAEVVLGLTLASDGYSHLHIFKDRYGDIAAGTKWGLFFNRDDGFRRDPDDGAPKKTATDKVRDLLAAKPGMTEAQLMEATSKAQRTISKALKDLGATSERPGTNAEKHWNLPAEDAQT